MAYEALYTRTRPKSLAHLVGQEHISLPLTRAVNQNRLAHAYLLVGTRGTGKTSTARLLAKAVNCDTVRQAQEQHQPIDAKTIPCNECASCTNFKNSPDNVEFDAASNRSVEDISRLLSTVYLAPLQSRVKTFIIDEVHMLSFEAVNSILKLIEEPPDNVIFFLATTEYNKVPLTIRSRCQILNFKLIPQEKIVNHFGKLSKKLGIEITPEAANKIARLARGSMRDALTLLDQCFSMTDEKVLTLELVDETLGLIADSDLDDLISAVKSQDRAKISLLTSKVFASGITAIDFAEELITRLRDLVTALDGSQSEEFYRLGQMIDQLRKAILEMRSSGIADIILETTLLKLASNVMTVPPITQNNPINQPVQSINQNNQAAAPQADAIDKFRAELDEDQTDSTKKMGVRIISLLIRYFTETKRVNVASSLHTLARSDFDGNKFTLTFQTGFQSSMFNGNYFDEFKNALHDLLEKPVEVVVKSRETSHKSKETAVSAAAKATPKNRVALLNVVDLFGEVDVQIIENPKEE